MKPDTTLPITFEDPEPEDHAGRADYWIGFAMGWLCCALSAVSFWAVVK